MLKQAGLIAAALLAMTTAQAADEDMSALLKVLMPGMDISDVKQLENTGMYEAVVNGDVLYFSQDLRYAFKGDVVEIATRQNITEAKRLNIRKQSLAELNPADLIVYPSDDSKYTVTVFTDIDCGYCRKLHQQIEDYNKQGITVRYMAFPRAGIGSESYDKAVSVWCADDRQKAMTMSKQGKTLESKQCENPVESQYELGGRMGVQGTPAIFLESGDIIPGYVPPAKLRELLEQRS